MWLSSFQETFYFAKSFQETFGVLVASLMQCVFGVWVWARHSLAKETKLPTLM